MDFLTIAEFAEKAGVSKQAIYKQVKNENSQIAPFILRDGRKILINPQALKELYMVDEKPTQNSTLESTYSTLNSEIKPQDSTQDNPEVNPKDNPFSTEYIEFLKAQVAELKAEKDAVEKRLTATIAEKDNIIKDQSAQLAQLAQQIAQIADKALITTAQQQYLTAKAGGDAVETTPADEVPLVEHQPEKKKKVFWSRFFGV